MDKLKKNIYNITKEELKAFLRAKEIPSYRADQIWNWLYVRGVIDFSQMKNLSKSLIDIIEKSFYIEKLKYSKRFISKDGTIKWLFLLKDNREIETVYIPEKKRGTICVSSQVGCTLSCSFCHTGTMKFIRNLDLSEIVQQVLNVKHELNDWHNNTEDKKVSNIVFMGMGEPLMNYNNVLKSIDKITSEEGLGMSPKRITVSTSGIPKMIKKLADEDLRVNLALSLHSAIEETRNLIMPFSKKFSLEEIKESLTYWYSKTKRKVTFEYIVWKDINDSIEHISALIKYCKSIPSKVNLIEYNSIGDENFRSASENMINLYKDLLEKNKITVTVRRSRGKDIDAACGQLANK